MREGWYYKITSDNAEKEYGPFRDEVEAYAMREFSIGWMSPTSTVSKPYYKKE
jgi:hypothetical protein